MRLDWLNSFLVFSEELNFTHAARRLHISQPALHVQISKFSAFLECPLYTRDGRTLQLTREGKRAAVLCRDLIDRTEALPEAVRTGQQRTPQTLCAGEGAYLYLLGSAVRAYQRRSGASVRLLTRDRDGTVAAVATGEAHVGVAAGVSAPDGLETRLLTEVRHVLVMQKAHPLASRSWLRLHDLATQQLIVPPTGRPLRALVASMLAARKVPWEVAVEATGWEVMIRFVELGAGVAIVNECCVIPRSLVAVPIRELPSIRYDLIFRSGELASETKALLDTLHRHREEWRT